ncbi:MAG: TetR family transcriptional regulator [Alphaproteobacteria bacterium]|nr:TetR family transcriptional regulator [Alphaproteobacteria bacterium]
MALAAERGWRRIALADIAAAAGVPMTELYARFPSKLAVLHALGRQADIAAAVGAQDGAGERPRDRLFDIVMRRLEALRPHRAGLRAAMRDLRCDPLAGLVSAPRLARSLRWMLEAAGLDTAGFAGMARVKALGVGYAATLATWLEDESPDMSATMARLDRMLRRVDGWTHLFGGDEPAAQGDASPP